MINLLPPSNKDQIHYARLNRRLLGYLRLTILAVVVLAGIFGSSIYYLKWQTRNVGQSVASEQAQIAGYSSKVAVAQEAAGRLASIASIEAGQTKFSKLLGDLAAVMPQGVALTSISLTGDSSKPVSISITASSYNLILAFRNAVATSPRIGGVDLQSISQSGSSYTAGVIIGFKPGEAR